MPSSLCWNAVAIAALAMSFTSFLSVVYTPRSESQCLLEDDKTLRLAPGADSMKIGENCPDVLPIGTVCIDAPINMGAGGFTLEPTADDTGVYLHSNRTTHATFYNDFTGVGSVPPTAEQVSAGGVHILGDPTTGQRAGFLVQSVSHVNGVRVSQVISLETPWVTGIQFHNEGENALTFTSDGKIRIGTVSKALVDSNPDAGVYIGSNVVSESRLVSNNFSCMAIASVGCDDGDAPRLQVLHVLDETATLTNGRAGDFSGLGAFQYGTCYKAELYAHIVEYQIIGDLPGGFGGYFKMKTGHCNKMELHETVNCTDVAPDEITLSLGEVERDFLLRCWCASPNPETQRLDYVGDIAHELGNVEE